MHKDSVTKPDSKTTLPSGYGEVLDNLRDLNMNLSELF